MGDIRINAEGDGEWIMGLCGGVFRPGVDQTIVNYRSGERAGGFALSDYMGHSIAVHMAGTSPRWCSRDLLSMVFHYGFVQLGCGKMLAPVASDNYRALELDLRAGWQIEAVLRDVLAPGRHLMVLGMTRESCPWLKRPVKEYATDPSLGRM